MERTGRNDIVYRIVTAMSNRFNMVLLQVMRLVLALFAGRWAVDATKVIGYFDLFPLLLRQVHNLCTCLARSTTLPFDRTIARILRQPCSSAYASRFWVCQMCRQFLRLPFLNVLCFPCGHRQLAIILVRFIPCSVSRQFFLRICRIARTTVSTCLLLMGFSISSNLVRMVL